MTCYVILGLQGGGTHTKAAARTAIRQNLNYTILGDLLVLPRQRRERSVCLQRSFETRAA